MLKKDFWDKNWTILVSILVFVTAIILSYNISDSTLSDALRNKIALRDGVLGLLLSLLLKVIYKLHQYQNKIEDQKDTIGTYTKLLSKTPKIRETVSLISKINAKQDSFHNFFLSTILDQYNSQLSIVQQGKYKCSPEDELSVTKKVLECCTKSLKAISYQDEDWWCSYQGTLYLQAHKENIDKEKEKAIRIFLIESETVLKESETSKKFKEIFKKHKELEIETYIIYTDKDNIPKEHLIDFVIYDDFILRRAKEGMNSEGGKEALFTTENSELRVYSNYFKDILTIAKSLKNEIPL